MSFVDGKPLEVRTGLLFFFMTPTPALRLLSDSLFVPQDGFRRFLCPRVSIWAWPVEWDRGAELREWKKK